MKKRPPATGNEHGEDVGNPILADLLKARGFTATEASAEPAPAKHGGIDLSPIAKIVLRREKKGRGGKTVTIVSGLTLPAPRLEALAREMRKGLGCGSTVEQGSIVLQGDIPARAEDWLRKHGAKNIVMGN